MRWKVNLDQDDAPPVTTPVRRMTMEKHLHCWLLHVVRIIANDANVEASEP